MPEVQQNLSDHVKYMIMYSETMSCFQNNNEVLWCNEVYNSYTSAQEGALSSRTGPTTSPEASGVCSTVGRTHGLSA